MIIGLSDKAISMPIIDFTRKELTILGSRNDEGLFRGAVSLVQRHRDRLGRLITQHYPLERVPEAIAFASGHPAEAEKVMIDVAQQRTAKLCDGGG